MSTNKPIHTIRDGACKVTIWRNEKPNNEGFWYEVTPGRTYTDQNDSPKTSHSFSNTDILKMAELMRAAYAFIRVQKAKDQAETQTANAA